MTEPELGRLGLEALTTLAAAFAGAWAAFKFEESRRSKEIIETRVGAGNRALYTLLNMFNVLKQYQKEVIDPCKPRGNLWLNMDATLPYGKGRISFNADELSFLLGVGQAATFTDVMLEEQRFDINIGLIERRSALLLEQAYTRLSEAGVRRGEPREIAEMEQILGQNIAQQLKYMTDSILQFTDQNVESLERMFKRLREALVLLYPKQKFIEVRFSSGEVPPAAGNVG